MEQETFDHLLVFPSGVLAPFYWLKLIKSSKKTVHNPICFLLLARNSGITDEQPQIVWKHHVAARSLIGG